MKARASRIGMPNALLDSVAYRIRAELVCCDLYEQVHDTPAADNLGDHAICFWGEAAARLVEDAKTDAGWYAYDETLKRRVDAYKAARDRFRAERLPEQQGVAEMAAIMVAEQLLKNMEDLKK